MIIWGSSNVESGKPRGAAELSGVQVEVFSANESEELLLWEFTCSTILYNIAVSLSSGAGLCFTCQQHFADLGNMVFLPFFAVKIYTPFSVPYKPLSRQTEESKIKFGTSPETPEKSRRWCFLVYSDFH